VLLILSAIVLWSTVPVVTRLLVQDGGVFSAAFLSAARLWVGAGVLLVVQIVYAQRHPSETPAPIHRRGWLFIAAAAMAANYLLYSLGLRYTTVGMTTVIGQVSPIATVLLSALLLSERLTPNKLLGMVIALTGVFYVIFHGVNFTDLFASQYFIGNVIQLIAALTWPFYAIGQTKLLQDAHRPALLPIFGIGAVLATLCLPFTGPSILRAPGLLDWAGLLFLGAFSTAGAYWLYAAGLQRLETSEGTMFNVLLPPLAMLLAVAVLGEALQPAILLSLLLVVLGLLLILWRRSSSPLRRRARRVYDGGSHAKLDQ